MLNPTSRIQDPELLFAALFLAAAACGATPKPPKATDARQPRVILPSGAVYRLELARTPQEQAQGLMFRESLPEKTGMLFLFEDNGVHRFWMKNTMIPLDMVWMDAEGRVLFVSSNTPPCKADPCPTYGPDSHAASVLEIAGGRAAREKIVIGSVLRFMDLK